MRALVEKELLKVEDEQVLSESLVQMVERNRTDLIKKIHFSNRQRKIKRLVVGVSIAASILLISTLAFFYFNDSPMGQIEIAEQVKDIDPGTNRATLLLESGESIVLHEDKTGIIINEEGIAYTDGTDITNPSSAQYAIMSTPRKGQYSLVLPDGTKVWLNAESSIRYPMAFHGNERSVELKGEAYFEVAHNTKQPFIVETRSQRLKVLGTVFNINDYADEDKTITTLITGKVELHSLLNRSSQILAPDQQAVLEVKGYQVRHVDVEPFIAWKNNEFRFKATPLREVLHQIERWYDLDIDYTHVPEDVKIHALIKRDKKLSSVLYALEKITNIKFKMEGRRLQLMEK